MVLTLILADKAFSSTYSCDIFHSIYYRSALLVYFTFFFLIIFYINRLAAMCNRRQLDMITILLYTFIVSALLAWGKWNRGNGIKGIAHFCWTIKRQTKQAVWQRPRSGFPRARQSWETLSYWRFFGTQRQELLFCFALQGFLVVCGEQT